LGGKSRIDPYDDFVLGHLGYWTDNGEGAHRTHATFHAEQQSFMPDSMAPLAQARTITTSRVRT
jgi:hypothetical protein